MNEIGLGFYTFNPKTLKEALSLVEKNGYPVELWSLCGWRRTALNQKDFERLFEEGFSQNEFVQLHWEICSKICPT